MLDLKNIVTTVVTGKCICYAEQLGAVWIWDKDSTYSPDRKVGPWECRSASESWRHRHRTESFCYHIGGKFQIGELLSGVW